MKNYLAFTLMLLTANSAFACLNQGHLNVCPGDRAVVNDGDGVVIAINPTTKEVSIDFSKGKSPYQGINTYSVERVSVGKGCLRGYCVGDTAVVDKGDGVILAVNPLAHAISIDFAPGRSAYKGINTYPISRVSVGKGCLGNGYCVGNQAVVDDGDGRIIGINPATQEVSIDFHYGHSPYDGINTYPVSRVSVNH